MPLARGGYAAWGILTLELGASAMGISVATSQAALDHQVSELAVGVSVLGIHSEDFLVVLDRQRVVAALAMGAREPEERTGVGWGVVRCFGKDALGKDEAPEPEVLFAHAAEKFQPGAGRTDGGLTSLSVARKTS